MLNVLLLHRQSMRLIIVAEFWETIARWWTDYAVAFRIILVIIIAVLARWLLMLLLRRTVNQVVSGVKKSKAVEVTAELAQSPIIAARMVQRTRTLGTVGGNLITWLIVVIAFIIILDQLGVSVGAIIASAGVVAAALAFGAQNIVKDMLNGLFMVFEDQLGIGDFVEIGEVSGTVEAVGVRVTQVRAIDGTLWFIRNGEIYQLGNLSHGWGRALVDIDVSTDVDAEVARATIEEVAREVIMRPEFARKVVEMPEVLGVQSIHWDHARYRLLVKTRPDAKWEVARALRIAVRRRFEQDGIKLGPEIV